MESNALCYFCSSGLGLFVFNIKFYFFGAISHQNNSEINNPQAERNVTCTTYLKKVDSDIFL